MIEVGASIGGGGPLPGGRPQLAWIEHGKTFSIMFWRRFGEDRCLTVAASLSYTSLLALVPLMTIGFAVMSAFPVFNDVQNELQAFLFSNFVPDAVRTVQAQFNEFVGAARGMSAVGVVGLAVTALLLFTTIEEAMAVIFQATGRRSMIIRLLVFWAILSLGPLLIGASFSLASLGYGIVRAAGFVGAMESLVTQLLPTALAVLAFALFYLILAGRPVKVRHALVGALVAGLGFALLRSGFALYIARFPTYQTLYGALAAVPIFLLWMYLSWAVVLAGAVVAAVLPEWGRAPPEAHEPAADPGERLVLALRLLAAVYQAQRAGRAVTGRDLPGAVAASESRVQAALAALRRGGFVDVSAAGRWLLARDPETSTLYDLLLALDLAVEAGPAPDGTAAAPWERRLAALMGADAEARRQTLGIPVRTLLEAAAEPPRQASPASFRRGT
jgi:membrane protein